MRLSENFIVEEFVPRDFFRRYGDWSRCWVRPEIVKLAEFFRSRFNTAVIINDWSWGGDYQYSGFRPPDCQIGAKYSQHRIANAIDMKFDDMLVQEVYHDIISNEKLYLENGLSCVESIDFTTAGNEYGGWIHADMRNHGGDSLLIVKP
jgi:hypothetical protein